MSGSRIFDNTYNLLGNALNISSRRHNLISSNIANIDTIGYKPSDLDFKSTLEAVMAKPKSEMAVTHPTHITPETAPPDMNGERFDMANIYHLDSVDIDREMESLVENNINYRTTAEMMIRKMTLLKHAISEGGR